MMTSYLPSIIYIYIYIYAATENVSLQQGTRTINREILTYFQSLLKQETWQSVYQAQDTNNIFNSLMSTFVHILEIL